MLQSIVGTQKKCYCNFRNLLLELSCNWSYAIFSGHFQVKKILAQAGQNMEPWKHFLFHAFFLHADTVARNVLQVFVHVYMHTVISMINHQTTAHFLAPDYFLKKSDYLYDMFNFKLGLTIQRA